MPRLSSFLKKLGTDNRGTTSIEYSLIGVLVAVAIVGAIAGTGLSVRNIYDNSVGLVIDAIDDVING